MVNIKSIRQSTFSLVAAHQVCTAYNHGTRTGPAADRTTEGNMRLTATVIFPETVFLLRRLRVKTQKASSFSTVSTTVSFLSN